MQTRTCMKHLLFASLLLSSLALPGCRHTQVPLPSFPQNRATDDAALVARGKVIVRDISVCGGCHAATEHDPDGPLSGGREFHDWRIGTARAANLTPDNETGLGTWSDAEIVRAIRNGQRKDGRLLAPVMLYEWYHEMSDEDALAVARYLKSLPPVHHPVRQDFNVIFKLGKLFMLRPLSGTTENAPARAATPEYGGYVSQHVGTCADCHTQRTGLLQKPDRSRLFAGMANPPKEFPQYPSNLTFDATGIATWSEGDFIQTIRTGTNPKGQHLHAFMPWQQNRRMSDDDLRAIYRFLRTLPAVRNEVPRKPTP